MCNNVLLKWECRRILHIISKPSGHGLYTERIHYGVSSVVALQIINGTLITVIERGTEAGTYIWITALSLVPTKPSKSKKEKQGKWNHE